MFEEITTFWFIVVSSVPWSRDDHEEYSVIPSFRFIPVVLGFCLFDTISQEFWLGLNALAAS